MPAERDLYDNNESKKVGGEKKTEPSLQVQELKGIKKQKSAIFESSIIGNLKAPTSRILNLNPVSNSNAKTKLAKFGASHSYSWSSFAILSEVAEVSCLFGAKLGSMFRGGLNCNGIWSVVGVVVLLVAWVGGSEFPERECCDPVYPPNTATTAAAPVTPPITKLAGMFF
ncbi:unnamed protein product [Arctia plantaginis]|uniref:Uncharacterized protein n=1 Tax=Arctia plantaginis TaxID=874455 RepID=A0A8S0ZIB2_ARCPL|nr:unnamed protein product [Arctia plantaginis]